jgi:hypothetical protein
VLPSASDNSVGAPEFLISRLDTLPACTPVNASPPPLRTTAHDSGAHFADGDHLFRCIAITRFGHHDRSEATLWS